MAKKKISTQGSPIGYAGVDVVSDEAPTVRDNNPDGPSNLPNHELYAYRRDDLYGKRICFPNDIGRGEASNGDDVIVNTADGIANTRGERGLQYNFNKGNSGRWGKNRDWDGSNLTGL